MFRDPLCAAFRDGLGGSSSYATRNPPCTYWGLVGNKGIGLRV